MNLRLNVYDLKEHAQLYMKRLGIVYQEAVPQSLGDQWWFYGCENVPDPLPKHLTILEPPVSTILPWHREAAQDIGDQLSQWGDTDIAAIIARHDPHASRGIELDRCIERRDLLTAQLLKLNDQHTETLRLLRALLDQVHACKTFCDTFTPDLRNQIRAHLAAHRQTAQAVGGGK